jgi:hypothetical protein
VFSGTVLQRNAGDTEDTGDAKKLVKDLQRRTAEASGKVLK